VLLKSDKKALRPQGDMTHESRVSLQGKPGFFHRGSNQQTHGVHFNHKAISQSLFVLLSRKFTGVCTENLIRVDDVMESPKLAE
jgi:hypothetical protein